MSAKERVTMALMFLMSPRSSIHSFIITPTHQFPCPISTGKQSPGSFILIPPRHQKSIHFTSESSLTSHSPSTKQHVRRIRYHIHPMWTSQSPKRSRVPHRGECSRRLQPWKPWYILANMEQHAQPLRQLLSPSHRQCDCPP